MQTIYFLQLTKAKSGKPSNIETGLGAGLLNPNKNWDHWEHREGVRIGRMDVY